MNAAPATAAPMADPPAVASAITLGLYGCACCGLVCERHGEAEAQSLALHCPRCGTPLWHRRPESLQSTWACLIAALLLYVPANVMPIMTTITVRGPAQHTILGGIGELWHSGSWVLALIVFVASIAVPMLKILALAALAWMGRRGAGHQAENATALYRLVETVGHWSMLDVYVVVLLVGMIRFGALGGVEPEPGLLAFGVVVVLTMVASASFDPRLLWNPEKPSDKT